MPFPRLKRRRGWATRSAEKRGRVREMKCLRRYGYVQEWRLEIWRFRRRRQAEQRE